MGYTPLDASFEDNNEISELDGAQIYDASSRRAAPRAKAVKKKEERRPENVFDAQILPAEEAVAKEKKIPEKTRPVKAEPVKAAPVRPVKAPARENVQKSLQPGRPIEDRPAARPAQKAVVKVEKAPREPITIRSLGQGLISIMSTKSDVRVKTVKNGHKKPLPVSAFAMAIICTLLLMFMVVSYVQINEYTVAVSDLRSELGDMVDRDKELTLELEKKNDMLAIEEKAGELGMVKLDQLTKKHVSITQDDKIEVIEPEPTNDSTVVTTIMSSIWQNFAGLREYLG